MGDKIPKEYVAELLKQLEELKRKKALKERKLQKLKGCSLKDLKKERAAKTSHISNQKESNCLNVNEGSLKKLDDSFLQKKCEKKSSSLFNKLNDEKSSGTHFNNDKMLLADEKCHSLSVDDHEINNDLNNHSDVNIQKPIIAAEEEFVKNHNVKTSVNSHEKFRDNSIKNDNCEVSENVLFVKPKIKKQKSNSEKLEENHLKLINDKLICNVEKTPTAIENTKNESLEHLSPLNNEELHSTRDISSALKISKTEDVIIQKREKINDVTKKLQPTNVSDDLALESTSEFTKNVTQHNLSQNEGKLSDDVRKSSSSGKSKSSDILDDSLNCNMSLFMSDEFFVNDDNDKKVLLKDYNECLPTVEKDSKINNLQLPSPGPSNLSGNGYQQNNSDAFNFPKFSTPTEGNTQVEKDDMPDLIEKSQVLNDYVKRNDSPNKAFKNVLPSTSKFESPLLNFVLEKRLSSVLDAQFESPKKIISRNRISSVDTNYNIDNYKDNSGANSYKKRKLFTDVTCDLPSTKTEHPNFVPDIDSDRKSNFLFQKSSGASGDLDQEMNCDDFENENAFNSDFTSSDSLKKVSENLAPLISNFCNDVPSQISKTVDGLVNKVCTTSGCKLQVEKFVNKNEELCIERNEESKLDSEILVIPETEGLGPYFSKDTEEFLETSTLSESMESFPVKENFLNVSSQSKLESPVVNNIVAAVKSSKSFLSTHQEEKIKLDDKPSEKVSANVSFDAELAFDNSLVLDTSFIEDDTQDLGNFKQVPYMSDINADERATTEDVKSDKESNLKFICSLTSSVSEPVMDVEMILFHDVKYAVLQHKTYICVWRQEKKKQWVKIFNHQIEDMLFLVKMCTSMNDDNLVIIMLLSNEEQYCLQFLIFEKDARIIKLMENTHWLEERCSEDSILLCGLSGLMFAIAQNKEKPEVSIHAFMSLKENPKLMTAVLGSTETPLCSLCKIDKLPNALMGIGSSMLYVWHILEARLVTAVSLHPEVYLPVKECFWATAENGLVYFLTTCEEDDNHHVCQLLAANLATGFCYRAMSYSTLPSNAKVKRIIKTVYEEPFLVLAHSEGAFMWSVMEEFCCAALPSPDLTSIALSRDLDNWGILTVGFKNGLINCYSVH